MSWLAARLTTALVVLAALVAGAFHVRALRAELAAAQQQRDLAQQAIVDRDGTIGRMQQDAADKAKQQAQLNRAHVSIAMRLNSVQLRNRRLMDENAALRAWADTPLPDDIVRLQASPAFTGADNYIKHVPSGDPVHVAGDGATHQR